MFLQIFLQIVRYVNVKCLKSTESLTLEKMLLTTKSLSTTEKKC